MTPNARLARAVAEEVARQMPLDGPARAAIAQNGAIVVTRSLDEAIALSERMAPEHVVCDSASVAARLHARGDGLRRPPERSGLPATTSPDRTTCCRRAAPRADAAG